MLRQLSLSGVMVLLKLILMAINARYCLSFIAARIVVV